MSIHQPISPINVYSPTHFPYKCLFTNPRIHNMQKSTIFYLKKMLRCSPFAFHVLNYNSDTHLKF